MRQMKNSGIEWIGEIPIDWSVCHFRNILDIYNGNSIKDEEKINYEDPNDAIPYIATKDIDATFQTIDYDNGMYVKELDDSFKRAPKNSILLCIEGGSAGKKIAFTNQEVCFINKLCCFNSKIAYNRYVYYYMLSPAFTEEFKSHISGLIGGVSISEIKGFAITFPPYNNQKRIAEFLDRKCNEIDAVIKKTKATIEEYKSLKQSIITEAVTKGIRGDRIMKDVGIKWVKEIPVNWENRKMLSILSMRVIDGPHESPELFDDGVPYVSANAIENGRINFDKKRGFISEEYCDLCDKRYRPQRDDILVIKLGATTGQVAIVDTDERFNIWVPLAAVRCNNLALPKFVYYAMQSDYYIRQMEISWTYGTQQTLGVKTIERLRIVIPELEEQEEIANYLDKKCAEIDILIAKKTALLEEMENHKKSVICEYVTGKKEVK